jgi:hypothetical protein
MAVTVKFEARVFRRSFFLNVFPDSELNQIVYVLLCSCEMITTRGLKLLLTIQDA